MAISLHYTTLVSDSVSSIHKHLPQFVFSLRRHMKGMRERNRFCCSTSSFTFDLPRDRKFALGSSEQLNLCYNYKKESHALRKIICLTCKLEKQPLNWVSCTGNSFYLTLFLGNQHLWRVTLVTMLVQLNLSHSLKSNGHFSKT